jgi:dipeptide/tripeptide permease
VINRATGLTKTFSLLAYTLPILGGIMADTKWGRFKTICIGTVIGAVAHIVLVVGERTETTDKLLDVDAVAFQPEFPP